MWWASSRMALRQHRARLTQKPRGARSCMPEPCRHIRLSRREFAGNGCPLATDREDAIHPMENRPTTRIVEGSWLATVLLLAGCATQPPLAPGPLGQAQIKLAEARSHTKTTETRIADYLEAAEVAEQEAESRSRDAATKQQALQLYNDACAEVTVLLEEADGGKYWNHNERIGSSGASYEVRFQPGPTSPIRGLKH